MRSEEIRRIIKIFFLRTILCRSGKPTGKVSKSKLEVSRLSDESSCACCLKPFIIVGSSVRCNECGCRSCRKGCSRWDTEDTAWHCLFCHEKRACQRRKEKWFDTFGTRNIGEEEREEEEGQGQGQGQGESRSRFRTTKSRVHVAGVEDAAATSGLDQATGGEEERNKMETLRDFIEKIVEGLIGSVDDSPIDRIYDHPEYDRFLVKYNVPLAGVLVRLAVCLQLTLTNKPCTDSPSMAHTALRELVERAVEEARKLPVLGIDNTGSREEGRRDITEHSYEDLLATAILNKVIEKIQIQRDQQQRQQQQQQQQQQHHHHHHHHHHHRQVDDNSNDLLQLERYSRTSAKGESALGCQDARVEGEEEDENEDEEEEQEEEECNGSLEALSQDDYSGDCSAPRIGSSRNHQEPLSLTIEERIEEITTTTYASDDEFKDNDGALVLGHARLVPFPEYGMDIVDGSREMDEEESERSWQNLNIVMNPVESWEANWLFQKKKIKSQAEPVSMLVPNSSADFKALIGDKDAEDTSDLSECSSTQADEEIEQELIEAINNVVPRSPVVIACAEICDGEKEKREFASTDGAKSNPDDEGFLEKYVGTDERDEESRESGGYRGRSSNAEMEFQRSKTDPLEGRDVDLSNLLETSIRADDGTSSRGETRAITLRRREEEEDAKGENGEAKEEGKGSESREDRPESPKVQEEHTNLPKTPSSTPRTSISTLEDVAREKPSENPNGREREQILDSLESAKRKLIGEEFSAVKESEEEAQQESEYTEHYELATRRHVDSLKRGGRSIEKEDDVEESVSPTADHDSESLTDFSKSREAKATVFSPEERNEKFQLATPPRPGTIAEREHKKWENAPPIPNNPYSQENIQKRLWEKQYVKKPSDISGINAESTTDNENDSKVVLVAKQSDINRFSRDYYINNSKTSSGDSSKKSTLIFNRPNIDHLEEPDPEKQEDVRKCDSEKLDWQKNNSSPEAESYYKLLPNRTERVDEFYENERKNSKNEINAKLNNQDDVLETSKSESQKIRRIDLKAYGFENEFSTSSNKSIIAPQRVVNKLDLKSFGYDSGVRRAQSTNQIDRIRKYAQGNGQEDKSNLRFSNERITRERNLAQSTETLNRLEENAARDFGTMSSAMSVPNISQSSCYQFGKMTLNDKSSCHDLNELSMPSVRRLAEVFDKSLEYASLPPVSKESKSTTAKERPSTPEILIVEPPKQMHSLTARSLSKQFREGLRQIPSKVAPVQPQNHSFDEKLSRDKQPEEYRAIVPGKLKSNINFWEKMQKRS